MAETVTEERKGILLETGTNEFEIVEFSIGKVNYGINVAKVREVITRAPVTAMPEAHPYVDGFVYTARQGNSARQHGTLSQSPNG